MSSFTWAVQTRTAEDKPWRVQDMNTEKVGETNAEIYAETKRRELSDRYDFGDPNTRLAVSKWAGR